MVCFAVFLHTDEQHLFYRSSSLQPVINSQMSCISSFFGNVQDKDLCDICILEHETPQNTAITLESLNGCIDEGGEQKKELFLSAERPASASASASDHQRSQSHFLHPDLKSMINQFYQSFKSNNSWWHGAFPQNSLSPMRLMEPLQLPHILLQGRVRVKVVQHTAVQSLEGNVRFHSFHISLSSDPVSGLSAEHHAPLPSWTLWHARPPSGNLCRAPSTVTPGAGLCVSSPEPPSRPLSLGSAWCNRWDVRLRL